ncbi:MAG: hypothetical protein RL060_142 [Bacteroidota bacterium]
MALPNVFLKETSDALLERLALLKFDSKPLWGKMNAAQLLAHLNVSYDLAYERKSFNNNFLMSWILKAFVKPLVVNEQPYKKNASTAPIFIIAAQRDFDKEKAMLIINIQDTLAKGAAYFEGKTSDSFGRLSAIEWNNMFYKHLDHHFRQFGI